MGRRSASSARPGSDHRERAEHREHASYLVADPTDRAGFHVGFDRPDGPLPAADRAERDEGVDQVGAGGYRQPALASIAVPEIERALEPADRLVPQHVGGSPDARLPADAPADGDDLLAKLAGGREGGASRELHDARLGDPDGAELRRVRCLLQCRREQDV